MRFRQFLVSGRVQGVSFRYFTQKRASALSLVGWVRNLRDGRVEILVQGAELALQEFEEAVSRGPLLARVDGIEKKLADADGPAAGFEIRADAEAPWPDGN